MVYVLDIHGQPLMPTTRYGKVRRMLKRKQAKVIKRCPFTIQLLYESPNFVQEVSLGLDVGSKTIGISATTETNELYASEVKLRTDVVTNLSSRRECRKFQNIECFIFGRRSTGQMDIRKLDGTHINASANYKNLKLLENSKHILTERSTGSFLTSANRGVSTS